MFVCLFVLGHAGHVRMSGAAAVEDGAEQTSQGVQTDPKQGSRNPAKGG